MVDGWNGLWMGMVDPTSLLPSRSGFLLRSRCARSYGGQARGATEDKWLGMVDGYAGRA
jgi:hypothetical protein